MDRQGNMGYTIEEAFDIYVNEDNLSPFVEAMSQEVVMPFLVKNYMFLHQGFEDIRKEDVTSSFLSIEKKKEFSNIILSELFKKIDLENFFIRFKGHKHEIKSYLFRILQNQISSDKFSYWKGRIRDLFERNNEKYFFWISPNKERSVDKHSALEDRNYYLSKWKPIPDLLKNKISEEFSLSLSDYIKNLERVLLKELDTIVEKVFKVIKKSLHSNQIVVFLKDNGLVREDAEVLFQREPSLNEDTEPVDIFPPTPAKEGVFVDETSNFYKDLLNKIPDKMTGPLYWYIKAFNNSSEKQKDVFLLAETLCEKRYSKNTIRNYIENREPTFFSLYEDTWNEYMDKDPETKPLMGFFDYYTKYVELKLEKLP